MSQRTPSRKKLALFFFSIVMLLMSWEGQMVDTPRRRGRKGLFRRNPFGCAFWPIRMEPRISSSNAAFAMPWSSR